MSMQDMHTLIRAASQGPLDRDASDRAFGLIFEGQATPVQIAGLLMAMRTRGESVDEYAAAAAAMRAKSLKMRAPEGAMDIVGTGGDGIGTLNISTAAAFVVAGCGVPVAKHGNRNLSSKSGAADALGALGIDVMTGPDIAERAITEAGIAFMMAPIYHPAMKYVMPVRQELGCKTIFNILGPLTNPAGAKRQLTGAFDVALIEPMAHILRNLGSEKAWLVHGADGTDEMSITGITHVAALEGDTITRFDIHPQDAGLPVHPLQAILGGEPAENSKALRALLDGAKGAYRDAVLLNAAAALVIADKATNLKIGAELAAQAIDNGSAKNAAHTLARVTTQKA